MRLKYHSSAVTDAPAAAVLALVSTVEEEAEESEPEEEEDDVRTDVLGSACCVCQLTKSQRAALVRTMMSPKT